MALARALAVEPEVLLLDEPFGALDARVRKELRVWLRRLHDETHVTTVFVTHDQEEAMDVADQIVVMDHGRIEQEGSPRELYEHPANEFVMSFIGPVNRLGDGAASARTTSTSCVDPAEGADRGDGRARRLPGLRGPRRARAPATAARVWAQVPRDEAERLELAAGQIVYARPAIRERVRERPRRSVAAGRPGPAQPCRRLAADPAQRHPGSGIA